LLKLLRSSYGWCGGEKIKVFTDHNHLIQDVLGLSSI